MSWYKWKAITSKYEPAEVSIGLFLRYCLYLNYMKQWGIFPSKWEITGNDLTLQMMAKKESFSWLQIGREYRETLITIIDHYESANNSIALVLMGCTYLGNIADTIKSDHSWAAAAPSMEEVKFKQKLSSNLTQLAIQSWQSLSQNKDLL